MVTEPRRTNFLPKMSLNRPYIGCIACNVTLSYSHLDPIGDQERTYGRGEEVGRPDPRRDISARMKTRPSVGRAVVTLPQSAWNEGENIPT